MRIFWIMLLAAALCAADPVIQITAIRNPIPGHRVQCFQIQVDQSPSTNLAVGITFSGTAAATTYTAPTTVGLSAGMPPGMVSAVIIDMHDTAVSGTTLVATLQSGSGYLINSTFGAATTTVTVPLADSDIYAMGEPDEVTVPSGSSWTYQLVVHKPAPLDGTEKWYVGEFQGSYDVVFENAPGAEAPPAGTITNDTPDTGAPDMTFTVEVPAMGPPQQYRFRLGIQVDVDGDLAFIHPGEATGDGNASQDIFTYQDIVLVVTPAGGG